MSPKNSIPCDDGPRCPRCKVARMRARHGVKGWFWGCSRFPECTGAMGMSRADWKRVVERGWIPTGRNRADRRGV
jgi:ssDNA-binding Zn-finger/Zn-ribbon topoisomerase 1